jgi:hypothetical protein
MKKVTIKLNHNGADTFEEYYKAKLDAYSDEDLTTLTTKIKTMVDGGDIWFRHFDTDGSVNSLVYILDSADAVTTFQTARDVLESDVDFIETIVEEISFEDFAAYASEHNETDIAHERKDAIASSIG